MQKYLEVYDFQQKKRLGVNTDGGYVIGEVEDKNYDCYISCGISNEESFSRDFIQLYGMNKNNSFGFDGTINDYPYHYTNNITFYKKNINNFNDDKNTDLKFIIENYKNIFLKMDIEGGEYPWLLSMDESCLKNFKQIVIEFHSINDDGWGYSYDKKVECMAKLANTHFLIHVHGNNNGKTTNGIPDFIELTYLNKQCFVDIPKLNNISFPINNLDFPNHPPLQDIIMNSYPFVSN
jgi:hypothetical protein